MAEMAKVKGVTDLGIFHLLGQPNLNIKIDREKAARYGLNTGDVNTVVQAALGGTTATTVLEGDRQFNLAVRLDPKYRSSIDAIRTVKVAYQTPSGSNAYIPLERTCGYLARYRGFVHLSRAQPALHSDQVQRSRPRSRQHRRRGPAAGRRAPSSCRTDTRIIWAGEFEDLQNAKQRLLIVVPITLLLDPGAAVWAVQFAARQPAGGGRHSRLRSAAV